MRAGRMPIADSHTDEYANQHTNKDVYEYTDQHPNKHCDQYTDEYCN
jgi:hypothetical protein